MTEAAHIPKYPDHWNTSLRYTPAGAPAITIHTLRENKKPIGYAPWPEEPKKPRKPRARKATT